MTYYENKYAKRQLTICFSLGQAVVSMTLPGRPRATDLVVSSISMLILLMINSRVTMTVTEIVDALQIDEVTVRKNLTCLTQNKYKILELEKFNGEDVEMTG